jgi:hypothetical protein
VKSILLTSDTTNAAFITVENPLFFEVIIVKRADATIIASEIYLTFGAGF